MGKQEEKIIAMQEQLIKGYVKQRGRFSPARTVPFDSILVKSRRASI